MKKAFWTFLLALLVAGLISYQSEPVPVDHRLIAIQAEEKLDGFSGLADESIELKAAIVDLGDDPLLLLKVRAALMVYPDMARTLFPLYASEPEFRRVLRRYGEHALPPIYYFLQNPVSTVEWMNTAWLQFHRALDYFNGLRGQPVDPQLPQPEADSLSPAERGWYAVNFIDREGADFLGQFQVGADGDVQWIQTERITEGLTGFFTGGIRQLEASYRIDGEITASEVGWASVDLLVFASAVKFLRAGRAVARATRGAGVTTRTAALAARVTGSARMLLASAKYAKWPALIGVGYLVVTHPQLVSDFFASAAAALGLPAMAVQVAGWALLLVPAFYVLSWLLIPLTGLLRGLTGLVIWLRGSRRHAAL